MKLANSFNRTKVVIAALTFGLLASNLGLGPAAEKDKDLLSIGKELFTREWLTGDRRSHAGDGLGPLFNARSCSACHNLGGIGGGGARHSNVTVVSVFLIQDESEKPHKLPKQPRRDRLARIHPALRTKNSFPFRRFSADEGYARWKSGLRFSHGGYDGGAFVGLKGGNYSGGGSFAGGSFGGGSFESNFSGGFGGGSFGGNLGGGGSFGGTPPKVPPLVGEEENLHLEAAVKRFSCRSAPERRSGRDRRPANRSASRFEPSR